MSRGGHSGHMTQLIVERMAALGEPATVEEITDAVAGAAHVPWNYIFQRYQQYKCQQNRGREVRKDGSFLTSEPDPQLGWSYPEFDADNPTHRRDALRFVVRKRLSEHAVRPTCKAHQWAMSENGFWWLNPDESQMPKIKQMNGEIATFDAETRAAIAAGKAAQVAVINRSSDRRTFDRLDQAEQATLLRWLTDQLVVDRAASVRVRPVLNDWRRRIVDHDAALDKLRDLLCRGDG